MMFRLTLQAACAQNVREWNGRRYHLGRKLLENWQKRHSLLRHVIAPPLETNRDAFKESTCFKLRMCVCEGPGQQSMFFHENVKWFLRAHLFPKRPKAKKSDPKPTGKKKKLPKTKFRSLMEDSLVVCRFSSKRAPGNSDPDLFQADSKNWNFSSALTDTDDSAEADLWVNVNYMNFNNLHFTTLQMESTLVDGGISSSPSRVATVPQEIMVERFMAFLVRTIDFDRMWLASFFEIVRDDTPLDALDMAPDSFVIKPVPESVISPCWCWRGQRFEEQRRDQQQRKAKKRSATNRVGGQNKRRRAIIQGDDPENGLPPVEDELAGGPENDALDGHDDADADDDADESDTASSTSDSSSSDSEPRVIRISAEAVFELDAPAPEDEFLPDSLLDLSEEADIAAEEPDVPFPVPKAGPAPKSGAKAFAASRKKEVVEDVIEIPGFGELRYNSKTNTMTAHCQARDNRHGLCRKSRKCEAPARASSWRVGGRPIGLLVAWLQDHGSHDTATDHNHDSAVHLNTVGRRRARAEFMALPNAASFAVHERVKDDGEDSEPEFPA